MFKLKLKSWLTKLNRFVGIVFVLVGLFILLLVETHHRLQEEGMASWQQELDADCALVLTGGPQRVREGFAVLARQQVRHLIISGVHPTTELADLTTPWDLIWGPDLNQIILEKRSTTTYGNAKQTLPLVEGLGCHKVELITSQLHMYRAFKTFTGTYPDNVQISKHPVPPLIATATRLEYWTEVAKILFYSIWAF